jgi:hypothetical protein
MERNDILSSDRTASRLLTTRIMASLLLFQLGLQSCGAKLPTAVTRHTPVALEQVVNLDEINLTRLQDGSPVNLGQFMRDSKLQWLVLTFGSEGCNICMDKADYLQKNLVDNQYQLLGASAKDSIALIGVTTDPASRRESVYANLVEAKKLTHFEWSDPAAPGGNIMMRYFQPAGHGPGVPLTVMLSTRGIVWRVGSWDHLSAAQIVEKIAATLGADGTLQPPPPVDPPPPGSNGDRSLLAKERPDRLNDLNVTSCAGRNQTSLGALLPPLANGLRAVLVHQESCDGNPACVDARRALQSWQSNCSNRGQKTCVMKEIVVGEQNCTGEAELLAGGQEFFEVFADHFSWSYAPITEAQGRFRLPLVKGPLTLIFDETGKLVFSAEGAIGDALTKRMQNDQLASRAKGPDHPLFGDDFIKANHVPAGAPMTFSSLRSRTRYTAVMFWNTWCSSCTEDIEEWHREQDSAYRFCSKQPEFCQVLALETGRGESGQSPQNYFSGLVSGNDDFDGWLKRRWTMPLAVEDQPLADGRAPMGWFAGWVKARFGSSDPRVVIYDSEGKVVGHWRSLPGEHGPRDTLKSLFDRGE